MRLGGLVGRERELAVLRRALGRAGKGHGHLVVVSGEAGIGKTRLIEAFAAEASAAGALVTWGHAWEAGGAPPLLPWHEALGGIGVSFPLVDAADGYGPFRLVEAVRANVACVAEPGRPVVLLFEDLHVADLATVEVLGHVSVRLAGKFVLVVATWRELEARHNEVGPLLARLRPDARVRLPALGHAEVAEMLGELEGSPVESEVVDAAYELSGGNPLFAKEAMALMRWGDVPDTLRLSTDQRLAAVEPRARQLVALGAVAGRTFDASVVADAAHVPLASALTLLDEAVGMGLVEALDGNRFRFLHVLVRDAVEASLSAEVRADHHVAIATVLETRPDVPSAAVARHYAAGRSVASADAIINWCSRAADDAMAAMAFADATGHLTAALETATASAHDDPTRIELLISRGQCHLRTAALEEAAVDFRQALASSKAAGRSDLQGRATMGLAASAGAGVIFGASGTIDAERARVLREALAAQPEGDTPLTVELTARLSTELMFHTGALGEVEDHLAEAQAMADRLGEPRLMAWARIAALFTTTFRDEPSALVSLNSEIQELAERCDDLDVRCGAFQARFMVALARGDVAEAEHAMRLHGSLSEGYGIPIERWRTAYMAASLELVRGPLDAAESAIAAAHELGRAAGPVVNIDIVHATQLGMLWRRRLIDEELAALRSAMEAIAADSPGITSVLAGAAACCSWLGELEHAADLAHRAVDLTARLPADHNWLSTTCLAADVLARAAPDDELEHLLTVLLPWSGWLPVIGPGLDVLEPVDRWIAALLARLGRWDEARAHLDDALEMSRRIGDWGSLLHTWTGWMWFLIQRGRSEDLEEARSLMSRVRSLATRHGVANWGDGALERLGVAAAPAAEASRDRHATIALRDDTWVIELGGREAVIRHGRGLAQLARLLASPGEEIHVLDLAEAGVNQRDLGPTLDAKAKRSYLARAAQLRDELADAEAAADLDRIDRIRHELEFIAVELGAGVGRHGRPRPSGSTAERARVSTTKAIRAAISRIAELHPELGGHLSAGVRTGLYCRYEPDPIAPISWRVLTQ